MEISITRTKVDKLFFIFILVIIPFDSMLGQNEPPAILKVTIGGSQTERAEVDFAETIYLAANLLDPNCLLRFPNGSYAPVSESFIFEPVVSADGEYSIELPTTKLIAGNNPCQLQFALIKIWLKSDMAPRGDESFVAIVLDGSQSGQGRFVKLADADSIICDPIEGVLRCSFTANLFLSRIGTIPQLSAQKNQLIIKIKN